MRIDDDEGMREGGDGHEVKWGILGDRDLFRDLAMAGSRSRRNDCSDGLGNQVFWVRIEHTQQPLQTTKEKRRNERNSSKAS